ncbi:MAG: 16S rRNA (adenine(1518)-N(6)/adenine(1519)-N(6))-dimethyltransferase RsmA [Gammaproteobacteria bacterium]|nr:16S rRNA (adenine(1518)-N(6)/adenine(1519)-N(6))-dimethyltransferase RsmA [Gammaproteobacteria bacterium]MDP2141418.1 16S rRNA (adenine(1518)-N(6)/adenine(1519)-N(6))-dimethyltransferase RsmA [Gammaproteobacteria bacterium]MDP2346418.1 16S rRNA (adenine(1518)-N(6)/adenine(1519)-N(6))-dimethyltransferase RsmA [Gammaproteobacteria bacterium]
MNDYSHKRGAGDKYGSAEKKGRDLQGDGFHHQARKRFGQNFLHDQNIIQRIVRAIHPTDADHMVEIGPGQGALTRHLLATCGRLDAVELDRDLATYLEQTLGIDPRFSLHQGDVLKFDFSTLSDTPGSLRIVGNLPYNISTPCMFHLLNFSKFIKDMTFMLQLEVVQRLAALPGDEHYGRLGIMMQYHCEVEHLFDVPATAFVPQPKVCSAIVRLTPHKNPPVKVQDVRCLQDVVRVAFTQRRKTLKNSLRTLISEAELSKLPIDLGLRPENLTLAEYAMISDTIYQPDR